GARLGHGGKVLDPGDVGRDLHEILQVATGRLQDPAQGLKRLLRLGADVSLADDGAARVPGPLTGDGQQSPGLQPCGHLVVWHGLHLGGRNGAEWHRRSSFDVLGARYGPQTANARSAPGNPWRSSKCDSVNWRRLR